MKFRLFALLCEESEMSTGLLHSPKQPNPRLNPLLHPIVHKALLIAGPALS